LIMRFKEIDILETLKSERDSFCNTIYHSFWLV
jgi:hypothetical protein